MHYTANGKEGKDRTRVGIVFANEPPKERVMMLAALLRNSRSRQAQTTIRWTQKLRSKATLLCNKCCPTCICAERHSSIGSPIRMAAREDLLKVPNYSFSWQAFLLAGAPIFLPKGTTISCSAWYDNSANNPHNPDPKVEVRYGDQSWKK